MNFKSLIRRLYSAWTLELPAYFLPCAACNHKCAIDASFCPNCGTRKIFSIPGRLWSFFATLIGFGFGFFCLMFASWAEDFLLRAVLLIYGSMLMFTGLIALVMLVFRSSILAFQAKYLLLYRDPWTD
jgi:hypothetical protein